MKRISLLIARGIIFLSILLGLVLISCGKSATVTTIITVSEDTTQYLPTTTENSYSITSLAPNERISFTPTYLNLGIAFLGISHRGYCAGKADNTVGIPVTEGGQDYGYANPEYVELIGKSAFENILSFSVTVDEDLFGDWQSIMITFFDVTVSGVVDVGGTQYTIDNLNIEVPLHEGTTCVEMPQPVRIDEEHNPVILVIFDVENCAYLTNSPSFYGGAPVPGYNDIYVNVEHLVFDPYFGESEPTVDKYEVVLDSDDFGDHTTFYLKVVTIIDQEGNLSGAKWHTVYREGYSGGTFIPDYLDCPLLTYVEENTYSIKNDPDWVPEAYLEEYSIQFPAFKLEDHSGMLNYGGGNYTYTATKRQ